jgi:hypothetical protein
VEAEPEVRGADLDVFALRSLRLQTGFPGDDAVGAGIDGGGRSRARSSIARSVSAEARSANSGWFWFSSCKCCSVSCASFRISSFQASKRLTSLKALARDPTSFAIRLSSSSKTSHNRLAKMSGRMNSLYPHPQEAGRQLRRLLWHLWLS